MLSFPSLAVASLKQQDCKSHQNQRSHSDPNEILHSVILGTRAWELDKEITTKVKAKLNVRMPPMVKTVPSVSLLHFHI